MSANRQQKGRDSASRPKGSDTRRLLKNNASEERKKSKSAKERSNKKESRFLRRLWHVGKLLSKQRRADIQFYRQH